MAASPAPDPADAPRGLGGADVFARVLDREIRAAGLSGFHSYVILSLDRRPDVAALRRALAADTPLSRGVRMALRRRFPGLPLRWEPRGPECAPGVVELPAPPPEGPPWTSLMNGRLRPDRGENVKFTLFPVPGDGWRMAVLFHHVLLDAKGAERLLAALPTGGTSAGWAPPGALMEGIPFGRRLDILREHNRFLEGLGAGGVHLCAGPRDGPARSFDGRAVLLEPGATEEAVRAGRRAAGYAMEGLWFLACLLAADRETDPRPVREGSSYVLSLPTSLDGKGEAHRVFGNHLSFSFLGVPVEAASEAPGTARALRDGLLASLRSDALRNCRVQLDLCRRIPLFLYSRLAKGTMGGAFGSIFFTNPGPVAAGLEEFFGAGVRELLHFPVPAPVPGLCAVTWRFRGRLGLGVTWVRDRIPEARAEALLEHWRRGVSGARP